MKINDYKKDPQGIGRIKLIDDLITVLENDYCYLDKNSNPVNWVSKYFGLVRIDEQEGKRFPVWMDGSEYITTQPNDNYKSIAFFYDEGNGTAESGQRRLRHNFNLIVWYNRDCITNTNYTIIDHLVRDAWNIILKQGYEPLEVFYGRDDVLSQFNINVFDERLMHSPYNMFRLRFTAIEICDYRRQTKEKFQSNL
jgi:hypothetical protein